MTPEEIAARLTDAQRWCVQRGGARYGTKLDAWRGLQALGAACPHDKGLPGRTPGRWTWRLTPLGQQVRAILAAQEPRA